MTSHLGLRVDCGQPVAVKTAPSSMLPCGHARLVVGQHETRPVAVDEGTGLKSSGHGTLLCADSAADYVQWLAFGSQLHHKAAQVRIRR